MKTYLKKIVEEASMKIDPQSIIGWDLCKKIIPFFILQHFSLMVISCQIPWFNNYKQFPTNKASTHNIYPICDKIIYPKLSSFF
jgi:hypothetical protein